MNLFGPAGSGKTEALRHLAAVLPDDGSFILRDADGGQWPALPAGTGASARVLVAATRERVKDRQVVALGMAPWGQDDVIEYLLATRRELCAAVMARLKAEPQLDLAGLPALWAVVLDAMCGSAALATPAEALRHVLASRLGDAYLRRRATDFCVQSLLRPLDGPAEPPAHFHRADPLLARLIGHRAVQVVLAAQRVVWDLAAGAAREHLSCSSVRFPPDLVREVAALASFRAPVMHALRSFADGNDRDTHAIAASLLHAAGGGWRPGRGAKPSLGRARLAGIHWPGVDLAGASIASADLSGASLAGAVMDDAAAHEALLRGASLRIASLRGLRAIRADLRGADLGGARADGAYFDNAYLSRADLSKASCRGACFDGADLRGARLVDADLRRARLHDATLAGAAFNGADLRAASLSGLDLSSCELGGANFCGAKFHNCDLQNVAVRGAAFRRADLRGCDLADSSMPGADFRRAVLRNAGLAGVAWEGADLRGADFTGARFNPGSARSGLVGSTTPCEGSRTGFYTDDYAEQSYRSAEELRKANLRGADLRGAKVGGCDFYLVDLRGARYTDKQAAYFRRRGAIL